MKVVLAFLLIIIAGVASWISFKPGKTNNAPSSQHLSLIESSPNPDYPPLISQITASAAVVMDASTGAILAAKNPDQRLMPASTTKMMTAYIALKSYSPEEIITISRSQDAIGKSTKFTLGEQYQVNDLLQAALINSGNDAALSLADHFPSGYHAFVERMNLQALKWGLKNTHFTNVSGVEEDNHYSSAYDLAVIAHHFISEPLLRQIVGLPQATISSTDQKYSHTFENTNELIKEIPGVIGIKTGWTENAGECLVTYLDADPDLILVVLNSNDRFQDTRNLIDQFSDL